MVDAWLGSDPFAFKRGSAVALNAFGVRAVEWQAGEELGGHTAAAAIVVLLGCSIWWLIRRELLFEVREMSHAARSIVLSGHPPRMFRPDSRPRLPYVGPVTDAVLNCLY